MLDQVLSLFRIVPDWDLDLMQPDQDLTTLTSRVLVGLQRVLKEWPPSLVLVQGDTTTAFATALAAFYERVPVGHIEAGLRTNDRYNPWPEEMNRRLVSALTTYHFAPTEGSRLNLLNENVPNDKIFVTGNTIVDALLEVVAFTRDDPVQRQEFDTRFAFLDKARRLLVVTAHRREKFGPVLEGMCNALARIGMRDDVEIVFPVHPNPNIQTPVKRILGKHKHIHLVEPLDYLPFVALLDRAYLILTDSGGIQEEAPTLGKPALVMRETTERPEGVEAGTVRLVGVKEENIVEETEKLLDTPRLYNMMALAHNPYGDGKAALRIASEILNGCSPHSPSRARPN
jgi:UDP-N-acetylglucosamine 2-epimerase (non-hydrolysing)